MPLHTAYLLLGGNQGDRLGFLTAARQHLTALPEGNIAAVSAIYQTAAWGLEDQADFLNQVVRYETSSSPAALLMQINRIEHHLGRIRKKKWAARVIDIDILYFDHLVLETATLHIPHPQLHKRRFTLAPLAEIAPDYVHPVLQLDNQTLLAQCPDPLEATVYA